MGLTRFPQGIDAGNEKHGATAITGLGTVATGLATVDHVVVSLANGGTALGTPHTVRAAPGGPAGSFIVNVTAFGGTAATFPGTVNWIAYGSV